MPKLNQKGIIPPLVLGIIAILIIGAVYFINQKSKTPQNTTSSEKSTQSTPDPTSDWKTYQDDKYDSTIKYPKNWTVENLPSDESTTSIRLTNADKSVFVLIDTIIGPSLENASELEKVVDLLEGKLKTNTHLKITGFNRFKENGKSGYIATGEETYDGKTVLFEERFTVSKNGRGIRMHSIYASSSKETNKPITQEIMSSFKEQTQENTPIKGVPKAVSEFLDNKDITKLETGGLSVNKGDSPPNIEGDYKADNFVATYVSLVREKTIKVGETISKGGITFSNQKSNGSIGFGTDTSEGFESRSTSISGKDACFTIYDDENFNKSSCKYTVAFVISGCKTDKGLANVQISSLMKSKTGEGCDDFAPIGYTIVGKEEDGLMEKIN